jgi:hypothetical protein
MLDDAAETVVAFDLCVYLMQRERNAGDGCEVGDGSWEHGGS